MKLLHRRMPLEVCTLLLCDLLPGLGCGNELLHKYSRKQRSQKL